VIHKIKKATRHLLLVLLIVMAISLSVARFFLLGVENYKTALENKIYELTEIQLEIGTLAANMRGFNPEIVLKNIHLVDSESRRKSPVKLEQLRLGINLLDLIFTQQLLPSSWVTLVGVELSIVRNEDGSLSIVGLNSAESEQPFWLLKGRRYEVLKSKITWLDKQRHAEPLKFEHIDLLIKNEISSEKHEIHLISQLPESIGESLRVSMTVQGNVFEKDNINGLVYIKGKDLKLAEVLTGAYPLGLEIIEGNGDFELWSQWEKSKNIALTGNVQATNLSIQKQTNKKKKTFKIDQLRTAFNVSKLVSGWQLGVSDFNMQTAEKEWPAANFKVSANHELTQLAASIEQLDLQQLSELAQFFVPLAQEQKDLLTGLGLQGQIKGFSGYLNTEKNSYAINGNVENIFTSSFAAFPQIKNFTASIQGTHEKGIIGLNTLQASLFFPNLFKTDFSIKQLSGLLRWEQQVNRWLIASDKLVLDVKDAETESKLTVAIPKNDDAVFMDLQSVFSKLNDVSAIPEYYPASIMSKDALSWLDNAFISGRIEQGGLLVYGELNQYPFLDGQGVFEVLLDAKELELNVAPGWPHLKNVTAEVLFQKDSLTVTAQHAEVYGLDINHVLVEIPSFENSDYLLVDGLASGNVADGLTFLQHTPMHATVDDFLDAVKVSGEMKLELDFKVPFIDGLKAEVNGLASLQQAKLNIKAIDLKVTELTGDLSFTEKGLFSKKIDAKALGYPVTIEVDSKNLKTEVKVQGKTSVTQLQKQFSFISAELLTRGQLKGDSHYQVKLDLPTGKNKAATVKLTSKLVGISSGLPGLLKKESHEKKALTVNLTLNDNALLPLSLNYSDELKVKMRVDKKSNNMYSAHIVYGNGKAIMPTRSGVKLDIKQNTFDIAEWMSLFQMEGKSSGLAFNKVSFMTHDLQWGKQHYGAFEMAMKRFDQKWQGSLSCSVAKGAFIFPLNRKVKDKIKLEMAYVNFSELMKIDFQGRGVSSEEVPLIDVFSEQLFWNGADLGSLDISTERIVKGIRFKKIHIMAKDHKIKMSADWIKQDKGSLTSFHGALSAEDIGTLLMKVGMANDLKDANASIEISGQWPKSPYQFSLDAVNAEIDLELKSGRISSIEPGIGRILGFIAMEQWLKRLTLNFGDLYKEGLSFNTITGWFKVRQGKVTTKDLLVDAIPARIKIAGEADLVTETLDYSISVVPKSSGAVPIAGTIVSRIAGTITQALTSDYKEGYFFGSKYQVTGKWDNMKVTAMHEQDGLLKKTWTGLTDFSWVESIAE